MIVKADKNYNELFRSAESHLGLEPNRITDLHEYFNIIDENLATIEKSEELAHLIRLPLESDEPYFEINANTREIKVPDVFQKNGLTVKGDKLAEIVYFKMDRFFDLQDFFNFSNKGVQTGNEHVGSHCYIEWYNPSASSADTQKGVDLAFAMSADENFIYFGWPIADYVSGDSGTIQFSVRFLTIKDNEVTYNYSTKIATCEVKTTLNFPLDDGSITAFSWESLIYSRPIYSGVVNSTESPAPALLYGILSGVADMEYGKIGEETIPGAHHEASGDENDGHNGEAWDEPDTIQDVMGYYLDIPVVANISTATQENQTLTFKWIKDGAQITSTEEANYVTEVQPAGPILDEDGVGNYPETAVKSIYRAHDIGKYTVWIGNKIEGKNKVRYVYTGTIEIPGAEEVTIDESGIVQYGYVGEVHFTAGILNEVEKPDLTYTWYANIGNEEGIIVRPANANPAFSPTEEGLYWCGVENHRNGDSSEVSYSTIVADIRKTPQPLTSLTLRFDNDNGYLVAEATHEYLNHHIEYKWNYIRVIDVHTGETGAQEEKVSLIKGASCEYLPAEPGLYYVTAGEICFDDHPEIHGLTRRANYQQISRSETLYLKQVDGRLVAANYSTDEPISGN